ncbi:hypothetical protein SAMN05421505_109199 [Sinosporangium album]|uniref:Uncharacterized protein n=1 Tax=Sinosporangium album TaxID=504805 RepID=A0A1G7YD32_9ACTN|nr:hypothetical protein [Sinosporangium album]SDG94247.1 hypothetical protein SAMN05421505_109199 [Sinosporangium album]
MRSGAHSWMSERRGSFVFLDSSGADTVGLFPSGEPVDPQIGADEIARIVALPPGAAASPGRGAQQTAANPICRELLT